MKNETKMKGFDRYENDDRILRISENNAEIGEFKYLIELAPGFKFEECISIHAWSMMDAYTQIRGIE